MKQLLFLLAFTCTCLVATAQHFEGKISYKNTYTSKSPGLTDTQLNAMMGEEQNWYLRAGDYRSETNGTLITWQVYLNQANKLYTKTANSDILLWNDAAVNPDEVISTVLHAGATTVLGYSCDELVLTGKNGVQKYYFSSKLPVNTQLFKNHQFGNWYAYLVKANAVPLKIIIDSPQFTLESVATGIHPMKLSPALFALPADVKTMPSPY